LAYQVFTYDNPLPLESGVVLSGYHLAYTTHGRLNAAKDNAVWIFHALTANSDPLEWWPGLTGEGRLFDPSRHFIVCVNMPGSCYGSIGPLDKKLKTGKPYYHDFPFFTPRDMIRAYRPLKDFLGIEKIHIGIGGSMGGQQLLEWAVEEPEGFDFIFPIATNARHSPWGIAFNTSQRMAIETDATWRERQPKAGLDGMKTARAIALLSYRNYNTYREKQPRADNFPFGETGPAGVAREIWNGAASYQRYQGEKLAKRFNAFSYYVLSQSMDAHDTGRGRGGVAKALQKVRARTLAIGIESDILFPPVDQQEIASLIPGGVYAAIDSSYGHDGFLLESTVLTELISRFLEAPEDGSSRSTGQLAVNRP
jgi:homoserine O-acetyltransferase